MLARNSNSTFDPDALSADAWMNLRRKNAYDLRGLQPVSTKQPAKAPSISSYFPGSEALEDQDLSELRALQAKQHAGEVEVDRQNRWMLAPVFGPELLLGGLEIGGLLGARFLARRASQAAARLKIVDTGVAEVPKPNIQPTPLGDAEKRILREAARERYAQANGIWAKDMEAQVHHRIALEFQHLYGKADPSRLANLQALEQRAHTIATNEWAAFSRSLNGRAPSQAEIYSAASRVDRLIAPYIIRPGVARPILPSPQD